MAISFSPQPNRTSRARRAPGTAVLGPTNTGKTHLAIERMLAHSSGMIGLPLECASMRSMARWVLPVLVGASTAVTPTPRARDVRFGCGENEMAITRPDSLV